MLNLLLPSPKRVYVNKIISNIKKNRQGDKTKLKVKNQDTEVNFVGVFCSLFYFLLFFALPWRARAFAHSMLFSLKKKVKRVEESYMQTQANYNYSLKK